jgi:hypothetical protein
MSFSLGEFRLPLGVEVEVLSHSIPTAIRCDGPTRGRALDKAGDVSALGRAGGYLHDVVCIASGLTLILFGDNDVPAAGGYRSGI